MTIKQTRLYIIVIWDKYANPCVRGPFSLRRGAENYVPFISGEFKYEIQTIFVTPEILEKADSIPPTL